MEEKEQPKKASEDIYYLQKRRGKTKNPYHVNSAKN